MVCTIQYFCTTQLHGLNYPVTCFVPPIYIPISYCPTFNFKAQIGSITSKISKFLYVILSPKNILSPTALQALYYSLIHGHLTYCKQICCCPSRSSLKDLILKRWQFVNSTMLLTMSIRKAYLKLLLFFHYCH
jgi:hypothetical protein